jgi:single-strand DNA-binding protein
MSDNLTLTGLVATPPNHIVTGEGLSITNFRLASNQRRYDRKTEKWVDGDTNWYTVTAFRQLANNVVHSVHKGQRIVVTGRLRVREWSTDEKKGTSIELDAEAIGHDLSWGTAVFTRSATAAVAEAESGESAGSGEPGEGDAAAADVGDPNAASDDNAFAAPVEPEAAVTTPF